MEFESNGQCKPYILSKYRNLIYGNPSSKFSIMEIMEICVVLCVHACTIATIFVERGQATNVYPPREFSDNERNLTMMASCILYKPVILLSITKML